MNWLVDMTISMLIKFTSVIIISPTFLVPGMFISVVGAWCGQVYIKAQLSVKREMSNARAPVLGHFGAAIAGLSTSHKCLSHDAALTGTQRQFVHMEHRRRLGRNPTSG